MLESTYDGFWANLKYYKIEEPEEFDEVFKNFSSDKIKIELHSVSLTTYDILEEKDY